MFFLYSFFLSINKLIYFIDDTNLLLFNGLLHYSHLIILGSLVHSSYIKNEHKQYVSVQVSSFMQIPHSNVASTSNILIIALAYNFKLFTLGYNLRVLKSSVIDILFLLIWYDVSNGSSILKV